MKKKYLIVGGGIAGTIAAETLRIGDQSAAITILEQEPHRVYNRTLLPSIVRNNIVPDRVFSRSIDQYKEKRINLKTKCTVSHIDRAKKTVYTTSTKVFPYDTLIFAYGGEPRKILPMADGTLSVHTFRTYDDALELKQAFFKHNEFAIIGGGFISLELILFAHHYTKRSHLILPSSSIWENLIHPYGGQLLAKTIKAKGTQLYLNHDPSKTEKIITQLHSQNPSLFVASGIGINSTPEWLQSTGLIGERGVRCNEFLQTEDPSIYACGDCAEFASPTGLQNIRNWQNAVASGEHVARNILGNPKPYSRPTKYQIEFHDLFITFTGNTDLLRCDRTEDIIKNRNYLRLFYKNNIPIGLTSIGPDPISQKEFLPKV